MIEPSYGFYERIEELAKKNPQKCILTINESKLTYKDLITSSTHIAEALRKRGVGKDDKVAMILPNSLHWYQCFWAIVKLGAIPVPLDPQVGKWEIIELFNAAKIRSCFTCFRFRGNMHLDNITSSLDDLSDLDDIIVVDTDMNIKDKYPAAPLVLLDELVDNLYKEVIGDPAPPVNNEILLMACTSGTTGNPKIIVVDHAGFYKAEMDMAEYLDFSEDDRMVVGMPLFHLGGFGMGLQMVLKGGEVYYQGIFDPEDFLRTIEKEKITAIQLSPTLVKIILSVPDFNTYDLSSVRLSYFAGEVLPDEIAKKISNELGIRVVNVIGSTETATMVVWDSQFDNDVDSNIFRKLSFTDFRVCNEHDVEVGVDEIGEIHIFTDGILLEYFNNQTETEKKIYIKDGRRWFKTGDLGRKLADGRIKFVGRNKRIIKRGANLIYPEEIESFFINHPDVEAIAITNEKSEIYGEMIIAHVQIASSKNIKAGDLIKYCRGKLAGYKIPDKFIITDKIPISIGKIQHKYLKK